MHDDNDDNNNNTYNGNNGNNSNKYNHHHRHHHHHLPKWYGTSQAGSHLHDNGPSYPCKTHTARGPVILAPAKKNRGSPVDDMHVNQNCSNGKSCGQPHVCFANFGEITHAFLKDNCKVSFTIPMTKMNKHWEYDF